MLNLSGGSAAVIVTIIMSVMALTIKYFPAKKDAMQQEMVEIMKSFSDVSQTHANILSRVEKTTDGTHKKLDDVKTLSQVTNVTMQDVNDKLRTNSGKLDKINDNVIRLEKGA